MTQKEIRVRMYRVGFGDCFLVTFPTAKGPRHMLIDCGVHSRGNIKIDGKPLIRTVVEEIIKETNGRIDIVVATHHHQDHISGFGEGADLFGDVEVREVWMPWTEDPDDKTAVRLRRKQMALAQHLQLAFGADGDVKAIGAVENFTGTSVSFSDLAVANNARSMDVLRHGFAGEAKARFLKAGDRLSRPADIPSLAVTVLGPPTSTDFLSKMDPPSRETYLAATSPAAANLHFKHAFSDERVCKPQQRARLMQRFDLQQSDLDELRRRAAMSGSDLAFTLDHAINNTSLVLLIEFGGKKLLFPGDAQWGSWKSWLDENDSAEILRDIVFYKVSHHGSVNATPKSAVEKMLGAELAVMVSTQSTPWPSIPRKPLLKELAARAQTRLARSDSIRVKGLVQEKDVPRLRNCFRPGSCWADYFIPV